MRFLTGSILLLVLGFVLLVLGQRYSALRNAPWMETAGAALCLACIVLGIGALLPLFLRVVLAVVSP